MRLFERAANVHIACEEADAAVGLRTATNGRWMVRRSWLHSNCKRPVCNSLSRLRAELCGSHRSARPSTTTVEQRTGRVGLTMDGQVVRPIVDLRVNLG
jgi:hypothetical protein